VKGTPAAETVAHLWSVYAKSGGTAKLSGGSNQEPASGNSKKHRH
jgi:hypothetical protein